MEIGSKIEWSTGQGRIISKGLVRQVFNDSIEVVCYEINGSPTRRLLTVLKEKIELCEQ